MSTCILIKRPAILIAHLLAVSVLLASCNNNSPSPTNDNTSKIVNSGASEPTASSPDQRDIEQEREEWKQAETLLRKALADQRTYMEDVERSGMAWGTGGQMRQLAGKSYFVDGEVPRGGESVSVVVSGNPNDHPDDVLYLGVRVDQRDTCIYARDVIERASASMTPGLVWAVAKPCLPPDEPTSWRNVKSPLELFDIVQRTEK